MHAQARELAALEEYRSGDMQKALGRAYLRMDELLVMEKHEAELRKLAGESDQPAPGPGRRWESHISSDILLAPWLHPAGCISSSAEGSLTLQGLGSDA